MTVVDLARLERVKARAASARPGVLLLALLAAVLALPAMLAAKVVRVLWVALLFAGSALVEGWVSGWYGPDGKPVADE